MNYDLRIIDGKRWAQVHEERLKKRLANLKGAPKIVSMLVGDDPASVLYSNLKKKKAESLGIDFELLRFSFPPPGWQVICDKIKELNKDDKVDGIMIQLPLPEDFLQGRNAEQLTGVIDPKKDVDGLTGKGSVLPAVVRAILSLLEDEKIKVIGRKVAVVGASDLVGKPVAKELAKRGGRVEIYNSKTENLKGKLLQVDLIVSATGVPHLIKGEMVKKGTVVIDVGTEKVDGKLMGDVDFEEVLPKAFKITPVPGGVGPMTVISLMENVVKLVYNQ